MLTEWLGSKQNPLHRFYNRIILKADGLRGMRMSSTYLRFCVGNLASVNWNLEFINREFRNSLFAQADLSGLSSGIVGSNYRLLLLLRRRESVVNY